MNNPILLLVLGLVFGLALGAALGWLIGTRQPKNTANPEAQKLEEELRQQLTQRNADAERLRDELRQSDSARNRAESGLAAAEKFLAEQKLWFEQNARTAQQAQEKALTDLREAFKALSLDALKQVQPGFLQLAGESFAKLQETAKGDLLQRQQAVATLVEPLRIQLETYQKRLQQSESNQSSALGEVKKHLEALANQSQTLASETLQLRRVLSSNQARGKWGEETLRRVVEAAGMSIHCDFQEQTQSGDGKPDLLVRLPGDRLIIVDAKVPDFDFLHATETGDETKRKELFGSHAAKLKATIKSLADRDYPHQFPNAIDYVVLFLPAESLFSAALEGDRELVIWASSKQILLTTPASLIALLRAVSVSWQQQDQAKNARDIAEAARELFVRVTIFTDHLEKIRAGLERANRAFNDAVGSYDHSVRPSGDRLVKLGAGTLGKDLAEIPVLDATLRLPPAATNGNSNPAAF